MAANAWSGQTRFHRAVRVEIAQTHGQDFDVDQDSSSFVVCLEIYPQA